MGRQEGGTGWGDKLLFIVCNQFPERKNKQHRAVWFCLFFPPLSYFIFNKTRGKSEQQKHIYSSEAHGKQHLQLTAGPVVQEEEEALLPLCLKKSWLVKQEDKVHHRNSIMLEVWVRESPAGPGQPLPPSQSLRAGWRQGARLAPHPHSAGKVKRPWENLALACCSQLGHRCSMKRNSPPVPCLPHPCHCLPLCYGGSSE